MITPQPHCPSNCLFLRRGLWTGLRTGLTTFPPVTLPPFSLHFQLATLQAATTISPMPPLPPTHPLTLLHFADDVVISEGLQLLCVIGQEAVSGQELGYLREERRGSKTTRCEGPRDVRTRSMFRELRRTRRQSKLMLMPSTK